MGWNTKSDGTGTDYIAGATIYSTSNLTLYATWGKAFMLGDTTGDGLINSSDALRVLRYSVGSLNLSGNEKAAADTDRNGLINSSDALRILQYSVGAIRNF